MKIFLAKGTAVFEVPNDALVYVSFGRQQAAVVMTDGVEYVRAIGWHGRDGDGRIGAVVPAVDAFAPRADELRMWWEHKGGPEASRADGYRG